MSILPAQEPPSGISFSLARLHSVLGDGMSSVRRGFHPIVLAHLIHASQFGRLGFHDGSFGHVFLLQNEDEAENGDAE